MSSQSNAEQLAMDPTPVHSPHPVFGRRPSLCTRLFGHGADKYWPTVGDLELFKHHMQKVDEWLAAPAPKGWPPLDPMLMDWMEADAEWKNRQRVRLIRDEYLAPKRPTLDDLVRAG